LIAAEDAQRKGKQRRGRKKSRERERERIGNSFTALLKLITELSNSMPP